MVGYHPRDDRMVDDHPRYCGCKVYTSPHHHISLQQAVMPWGGKVPMECWVTILRIVGDHLCNPFWTLPPPPPPSPLSPVIQRQLLFSAAGSDKRLHHCEQKSEFFPFMRVFAKFSK